MMCLEIKLRLHSTQQVPVEANRELIARFEKKIQATLARVWGEDKPALGEARL
jgi:hypothetical protein